MVAYGFSFPTNLVYMFFLKLWHEDLEIWEYKVRQLLKMRQKEVITSHYKVITKLSQSYYKVITKLSQSYHKVITKLSQSYHKVITKLLQSYHKVITKCDRSLLQSASGITKCDRLLLQSALAITKCASYYRVRRNSATIIFEGFHDFLNYLAKNFWSLLNSPHLITQQCIAIVM